MLSLSFEIEFEVVDSGVTHKTDYILSNFNCLHITEYSAVVVVVVVVYPFVNIIVKLLRSIQQVQTR